ncbi:MAG: bile acid:sodium symporter family protein [Dehalococcoidales bacterium]
MAAAGKLLKNRNFILILAIVLGLTIGEPAASRTEPLVLPLLALVMTLSATNITSREFTSLKAMPRTILLSLLLNYVVMGGVILLMAWWLIDDSELWTGFVVLATVPPAVAVVPFSYILGGNTLFSLIGMTGAYLAALAIMPAVMALLLGVDFFEPAKLLLILGELILIPIVASRILLFTGLAQRLNRWRGTMVNWSFFVTLFTIVGLNRQAFFGEFDVLLKMAIIAIIISFVLGEVIEQVTKALKLSRETSISLILMGTLKNYGLASGILLTLFSERAAIPASICTVFGILRLVWLGFHFRKPD